MPTKIIDPYATASSGEGHLNYAPTPPAPSAQTKGPNVINIFVPSEHTSLDYGAGKIPGVRVATDNHVHLTARTPLTTVSLGSPGGDGISVPVSGIQITSQGEKLEHIVQRVRVVYDATEDVVIASGRTHYDRRRRRLARGGPGGPHRQHRHREPQHQRQAADEAGDGQLRGARAVRRTPHGRPEDPGEAGGHDRDVRGGGNVELEAAGHVKVHHGGDDDFHRRERRKVTVTAEPQIDINCQGALVTITWREGSRSTAPSEIKLGSR